MTTCRDRHGTSREVVRCRPLPAPRVVSHAGPVSLAWSQRECRIEIGEVDEAGDRTVRDSSTSAGTDCQRIAYIPPSIPFVSNQFQIPGSSAEMT